MMEAGFLLQLEGTNNEYYGQIYTACECWKGHAGAIGAKLGLSGMRLEMSIHW